MDHLEPPLAIRDRRTDRSRRSRYPETNLIRKVLEALVWRINLKTSFGAIDPDLASRGFRQFSGDQCTECAPKLDDRSCFHFQCPARKDSQIVEDRPSSDLFGGY